MKNLAIVNGNFTTNGNFSGYTVKGSKERVFIHKRQMESVGWKTNEDVKFPFYVISEVGQINPFDGDGKPQTNPDGSLKMVERLSASAVFTTKDALLSAHVDVATLDIEIRAAVGVKAKAAGLTNEAIAALEAAAL